MEETHIHKLRIESGQTQDEAADSIGLTQSTFQQWEAGNRGKSIKKALKALMTYYNVSSDYLLEFTEVRDSLTDADKELAYRINRVNNPKLVQYLLGILDEFDETINEEQKRVSK